MKKYSKGIFSLLLIFAILLGLFPAAAAEAAPMPATKAGATRDDPVVCDSFAELKAALEDQNIQYVTLKSVDEILPVTGALDEPYAIGVQGKKVLNLAGEAVFTAAATGTIYNSLIRTESGSELIINGSGGLTFRAVSDGINATLQNCGGRLTVNDGRIYGNCHTASYARAIWQNEGSLFIYGGAFSCDDANQPGDEDPESYPVTLSGGRAYICGGRFDNEGILRNRANSYGLGVVEKVDLTICAGKFQGILVKPGVRLSNYIEEGCVALFGGDRIDPAKYDTVPSTRTLEVYKEIPKLDVNIDEPFPGVSPSNEVYFIPMDAYLHTVHWFENGEEMQNGQTFVAGHSYKVEIYIMAEDYARFANPLESATVNTQRAEVTAPGNKPEKALGLTLDFGNCPASVKQVKLTVTAPGEGKNPSYTVGCAEDAYYAAGGSSNYKEYRRWYMSSDGYDWWEVNESHKFMSGYYYKFCVDILTKSDYRFPTQIKDDSLVPRVSATVNGNSAQVIKVYDQDPSRYITVEYDFGECNDSVVENLVIDSVTPPVAYQKPAYTAAARGSGYHIRSDDTRYVDDNAPWHIEEEDRKYYIINGVGWFDMTKFDWVYADETFIPGHEYEVRVYLETEEGYEFAHSKYYEPTVTASVNGFDAAAATTGSDCVRYQQVEYTFSCQQPAFVRGDLNLDGKVDTNDVVELLLFISMPDMFPLKNPDGDFDNSGKITTEDAVTLLLHISMPDMFPL